MDEDRSRIAMSKRAFLPLLAGLALSAGSLYLLWQIVPVSSIYRDFQAVEPLRVAIAALFVISSLGIKALRWKVMLSPYARLSLSQAYHPLTISLTANCVIPGRVGELVRPLWHKARGEAPLSACAASLAAERCFDLMALLTLLAATFWMVDLDGATSIPYNDIELSGSLLLRLVQTLFLVFVLLLAGILLVGTPVVAARLKQILMALPNWIPENRPRYRRLAESRICRPVSEFVERVAEGFAIMRRPREALICILLSFAAWLLWAGGYYVLILGSASIRLSFIEATASMVIICLFIALPSVPGYWGLWEAGGVFSLALFGVPVQAAAGLTLVNHAVQILPVCIAGLLSMWLTGFRLDRWRSSSPFKVVSGIRLD